MASPLQPRAVMKKTPRKIELRLQTIRSLSEHDLGHVVGGTLLPATANCFIMKDTIIIRTSG